jgi:hypothetical protein
MLQEEDRREGGLPTLANWTKSLRDSWVKISSFDMQYYWHFQLSITTYPK